MRGFYSIIICSVLVALTACNFQKIKQASGDMTAAGSGPIPMTATVSWSLVKNSVLVNCMTCHSGKTNPDLSSCDSARQNINLVLQAVTGRAKKAMPPADLGYAPLTNCRIAVLQKWSDLGAPDQSATKIGDLAECQNQPGVEPEKPISEMPLNYETLVKKILQPRCLKCHNDKPPVGEEDAGTHLFYPYTAIVGDPQMAREWAAPGAQSRIVKFLTRTDDKRMPPPDDPGSTALTQEEVDFVIKWIDAGNPEK